MTMDYWYILNFFNIFVTIFIILILKKLDFFNKATMGIGFFIFLWFFYYFVFQPLLGPFYFNKYYATIDFFYVLMAYITILIFIISIYFGLFFNTNKIVNKLMSYEYLKVSNRVNIFLFIVLIFYMIYNTLSMYGTLNIMEALSKRKEIFNNDIGTTSVYFRYFINSIFTITSMIFLTNRIIAKKTLMAFIFTIIIMYFSLFTGSKYGLLWIIYFIALNFFINHKPKKITIFSFMFIIVVAVPFINLLRSGGNIEHGDFEIFLSVLLERSDFLFGLSLLIESLSNDLSYSFGVSIVSIIFRFIPRIIFPDRPGSVDAELTEYIFHTKEWIFAYGGIGEFYYNFGFFGVIIIGILAGIVFKIFNNLILESLNKKKYFIIAIIIASPVWRIPWAFGINGYFGIEFLFWLFALFLYISIDRIFSNLRK